MDTDHYILDLCFISIECACDDEKRYYIQPCPRSNCLLLGYFPWTDWHSPV